MLFNQNFVSQRNGILIMYLVPAFKYYIGVVNRFDGKQTYLTIFTTSSS